MELLAGNKPDIVSCREQLVNRKMDFDNVNERAKSIEQNIDDGIKSCEDSVVSEHNMAKNIKSLENGMSDFSDSVVHIKGCEENIDTSHEQVKGSEENIDTSHEQVKGSEENIDTSHEQVKDCEENIDTSHEQIKGCEEHIDTGHEQVKGCEENIDTGHEQVKDSEENIDTSHEQVKDSEENIDTSHEQVKDSEEGIDTSHEQVKDCEENIDTSHEQVKDSEESIDTSHERNDKDRRCIDKEPVINEKSQFLVSLEEREDNNIERFEDRDNQDVSQSAMFEEAVKEDRWMMSNKGVKQDGHMFELKSEMECQKSASSAIEDIQISLAKDQAPKILECPVTLNKLEISSAGNINCYGNENTSGSSTDQHENDLLDNLDKEKSSCQDQFDKHKMLIIPKKEVETVEDLEGYGVSYSTQFMFPTASKASHGDVEKEKTVQNADRNLYQTSASKCNICGMVCKGQVRMVNHLRVHSGERPFDCKVCGFKFKYKDNLERHQKRHKSSKQRNTKSPHNKQMQEILEQSKRSNSEYSDIQRPFQSFVIKNMDNMKCVPQNEYIEGCSASKDNFAETNACKKTEGSTVVTEYVNSHCKFLKGNERKLISSADTVINTEQSKKSSVKIFACSVVLDKINLQEQKTEMYLKHCTKAKLPTSFTPVQIQSPPGQPVKSKTNAEKEGSTNRVEKNDPHSDGVFKCLVCGKCYFHRSSLDRHTKDVHPESVLSKKSENKIFMCKYKCDKCALRFFNAVGLIKHKNKFCSMKSVDSSEDKKMSTDRSNKKASGKEAQILNYEFSTLKPNSKRSVFSSSEREWGSRNEKTNICRFCGRVFSRRINLCQHEQMHIRKRQNATKSQAEHQSSSSKSSEKTNICRFCGRVFSRRINLCQHEQMHIRKRQNATKSQAEHQSSSSKSNEKTNICRFCGRVFSRRINLCQHEQMHIRKRQNATKSQAEHQSSSSKSKHHKPRMNSDELSDVSKPHKCRFCGRMFSRRINLIQHKHVHIQNKRSKHVKMVLDEVYQVQSNYQKRSAEPGKNTNKLSSIQMNHKCRFCSRQFFRRCNLCQHERVCCRTRQIVQKQKSENNNSAKADNSNSKKESVSSIENPFRNISTNKLSKCRYCGKVFSQKSNLNRHLKLHKRKRKFVKQVNNSSRRPEASDSAKKKSLKSIRNRLRITSTDNLHLCQYCGILFSQKWGLSQHLKLHSQKKTQLKLENIMKSSSSVTTDLHTDTSESGQNVNNKKVYKTPHICRFCGRLFTRRVNLCQHEQWHSQKNVQVHNQENVKSKTHEVKGKNKCDACGKICINASRLLQHYQFRHTEKLTCKLCNISSKNLVQLKNHMITHVYETDDMQHQGSEHKQQVHKLKTVSSLQNRCSVCAKICRNKSDLLLHYEFRHTKSLKCKICNTFLKTYVELREHMRTHVGFKTIDMKELSCLKKAKDTSDAHCPKKTEVGKRSWVSGKLHEQKKSKKYKCTGCGMNFNTQSLLFQHKKKHVMSPHACFVCGKTFRRKFDLAIHLRIHTGDQPHECDICLKGFLRRNKLAEHMGTHVLKEANEFQCERCKALFCDQQSILNHLESTHTTHQKASQLDRQIIHNDNGEELQSNEHVTGRENIENDTAIYDNIRIEKPIFSCGICGEAYEEESHLYMHMGNHAIESTGTENGKKTYIKAEYHSPDRQMDIYQHSCKLETHSLHNDMQNSEGHVYLSDFVDSIKNETFRTEASSPDSEGNTFDCAAESLSDEYIDVVGIGDTVNPLESVSEFQNVNPDNKWDERTSSVDNNGANTSDVTNIIGCSEQNKGFKCGLCMHLFSSKQGLSQHKRWHAITDTKFNQMKKDLYCTFCKIYFSSKSSLTLHMNWHKNGITKKLVISDKISIPLKPYRCEKCEKTFARKESLVQHKRIIHCSPGKGDGESWREVVMPDGEMELIVPNGFKCEICGYSYSQRSRLVQHLLYKHSLVEKKNFEEMCDEKKQPFKCQLCGRVFLNKAGLTTHNQKVHKGKHKAYRCSFCNKEYIQRRAFLLHTCKFHPSFYQQVMGKMAEKPSNQKQCKYCKSCYNPNDNIGHEDGLKCESCEKKFSCKRCFIQHLDLPESAELESVFWCCVCQINFTNRKGLKEHVPVHASDLGKHHCRMCSQVFKYKQHLFRHEKVHGLSLQYSLKESYTCKWCNKEFPYEYAMRLHQKTKHKSEQARIEHKTKRQVQMNPRPYNSVNLTNEVQLGVVSSVGVGSDIFSSQLPRQQDAVALDRAYRETSFTKPHDETICKHDRGQKVASNLGSSEVLPVTVKQEPADVCNNSVSGSTCSSHTKEVQNNGIVHNSDTSIQDSPLLNGVSFDTPKFDLSASVELSQRVEQDDIQSSFEDSDRDEFDIDDLHDGKSSTIDRLTSDMLYFVRETRETSQDDSLDLLEEVLEKQSYSETQSSHKSPPVQFKVAAVKDMKDFDEQQRNTGLPLSQLELSNTTDHSYCQKSPNDSEDNADDASKEEVLDVSKRNQKSPEKPQAAWRKVVPDDSYHQEDQIAKDSNVSSKLIKKKTLVKVSCLKCLRVFTRLTDLRNHMKVHSEKNFLSFTSYANLNEMAPKSRDESTAASVNEEHKEQIQCFICRKLVYSQELVRHLQSHADLKLYECKHCDECFSSATSYSEHMEQNYGKIVCYACGETFTERKDLPIHLKKHNFDVIQKCSICRAIFTSHDTFSKHLEIHVISEERFAENQNDSSDENGIIDTEASSTVDREEEEEEVEENLRALMEDQEQGDAGLTLSSGITSTLAAWKQTSTSICSVGSDESPRRDISAAESIHYTGQLLGSCEDAASTEVDDEVDIKPDINKLHDVMLMQNAYKNMETLRGFDQNVLDRMVQNSPCQVRPEEQRTVNTVSGTPSNWYQMWKRLAGKASGSEHTQLYNRWRKEQGQGIVSTDCDGFPVGRNELKEPATAPVIKKECFDRSTEHPIEQSKRPKSSERTGRMPPGIKPCYVKLERIDGKIFKCTRCPRILLTENALEHHLFLHFIPGFKFSEQP